jgi:uncharacterized protein YciI
MTKHWLLFYEGDADYVEQRQPYRPDHIVHAQAAAAAGELIHGGALGDPPTGSVLSFLGDTAEVAEKFARNDPYVKSGVVKKWRVERWTVVIGEGAETI